MPSGEKEKKMFNINISVAGSERCFPVVHNIEKPGLSLANKLQMSKIPLTKC